MIVSWGELEETKFNLSWSERRVYACMNHLGYGWVEVEAIIIFEMKKGNKKEAEIIWIHQPIKLREMPPIRWSVNRNTLGKWGVRSWKPRPPLGIPSCRLILGAVYDDGEFLRRCLQNRRSNTNKSPPSDVWLEHSSGLKVAPWKAMIYCASWFSCGYFNKFWLDFASRAQMPKKYIPELRCCRCR